MVRSCSYHYWWHRNQPHHRCCHRRYPRIHHELGDIMRMLLVFLFILPLAAVGAAEAADAVAVPVADGNMNMWAGIITTILGIVLAWGGKLLREKWKIEGQKKALDATKSLWE